MRYYTHLMFSFLVGIILIKYLDIKNQVLFIILCTLAGLLPDLDEVHSKISEHLRPVSWLIKITFGHRGVLHAIWIPILLYVLCFKFSMPIAIAVSAGYLSHLILDALTPAGIQPLWPLKKRIRGFVRTGSLVEYALCVVLLISDVFFLVRL